MKKFSARTIFSALLSLAFFLNPLASTSAASNFISLNAPAEITMGDAFEVSVELAGEPNSAYYLKARLGLPDSGNPNKGRTYDEQSGVWLTDTVSWNRFPSYTTNGDGVWSGKIKVSFSPTAAAGEYHLIVRAKKIDLSNEINSNAYKVVLKEVQKTPDPAPKPKADPTGEPIVNEFLASPTSGSEWVEIKNKGIGIADLSGWKLDDEPGKSVPYVFPASTFINPGDFLVVNFPSPKLNESADQVRLLKADDSVVETYAYEKPEKGKSFAKDSSGAWFIADPTPGSENPNPPSANGTSSNITNQTIPAAGQSSETLSEDSPELPVLSVATKSATVAAVAAENVSSKNALFNLLIGGLGVALIVAAILIVFKEPLLKLFRRFRPTSQPLPQA